MKFEELIILLPCHSLEDFPVHHEGDDAQGLLAGWTALWQPEFIASAQSMPTWRRVDDTPEELAGRLIVSPSVSEGELPTGFAQRCQDSGAVFIRNRGDRGKIIAEAFEPFDGEAVVEPNLAADFLALGYGFLQVELLTRQMRYSSNLDEIHFQNQVVAAANAAITGDEAGAREKLAACFDILLEERDHYYPVDAYFVDLTLLAASTLGAGFRRQLASETPTNVIASGELLEKMAQSQPESLEKLQAALEAGRASLVGGLQREVRTPLLSPETLLAQLKKGSAAYETHLKKSPQVFGQFRFGLTPLAPQVLHKLGFHGALHCDFEDGQTPEGSQIKVRWEGPDGATIDALARAPLNAERPESYLGLAVKLGESMDMDHVATIMLAHWPDRTSPWHDDLRRIAAYGPVLGRFITLDEFFRTTDLPGQIDRFEVDQYESPYLKQAVAGNTANPISNSIDYWRLRHAAEAEQALAALVELVTGREGAQRDDLLSILYNAADEPPAIEIETRLQQALAARAEEFAACVSTTHSEAEPGLLVANPLSFVRRIPVLTTELEQTPDVGKPVYAAASNREQRQAVVDAPAMGFAWAGCSKKGASRSEATLPLADENVVRNEFFEATIDPATGALQSLHEYSKRGNRISQQLALRTPAPPDRPRNEWQDPDAQATYSVMAADALEVTSATSALGEITVQGRLLDRNGKVLAHYRQAFQAWRGSRVLRLRIKLDPIEELGPNPWTSYYCCRFAWADESASLWRTVNLTRHQATRKKIETSHYLEIENADTSTTILTGGLPFHRKRGFRSLDSLLVVRGETRREFELGIGMDLSHPILEAVSLLAPPPTVVQTNARPKLASSWLFHIDAKNLLATYWAPIWEEGRTVGVRVRMIETSGRVARAKFSGFRPFGRARIVDFRGQPLADCEVRDGVVHLEAASGEWLELEARWES